MASPTTRANEARQHAKSLRDRPGALDSNGSNLWVADYRPIAEHLAILYEIIADLAEEVERLRAAP